MSKVTKHLRLTHDGALAILLEVAEAALAAFGAVA